MSRVDEYSADGLRRSVADWRVRWIVGTAFIAIASVCLLASKNSKGDEPVNANNVVRSIQGRITDELGQPIAGAEIRLGSYTPTNRAATSGQDGRFTLEKVKREPVVVIASAAGRGMESRAIPVGRDELEEFILKPSPVLRIRIEDERGQPLEGVSIRGDDWRKTAVFVTFTTNREGIAAWLAQQPAKP